MYSNSQWWLISICRVQDCWRIGFQVLILASLTMVLRSDRVNLVYCTNKQFIVRSLGELQKNAGVVKLPQCCFEWILLLHMVYVQCTVYTVHTVQSRDSRFISNLTRLWRGTSFLNKWIEISKNAEGKLVLKFSNATTAPYMKILGMCKSTAPTVQ